MAEPPYKGFDPAIPSPARVYDALLGGKDNYAADRALAAKMIELSPLLELNVRDNRGFLRRAIRFLIGEHGVTRFLDIGSGLPTQENVHQVAHDMAPDARVVYVDHDPSAVAHGQALMAQTELVSVVHADLRDPDALLRHPDVVALLGAGEPVALLIVATLHFISEEDGAYRIVRRLLDALPAGSFLVISHGTDDMGRERAGQVSKNYQASESLFIRSGEDILRFFEGTELVEPGLAWSFAWRPDIPIADPSPERKGIYAGVGRVSKEKS